MDRRVSLITLGVADLDRAAAFYEALGWRREEAPGGVAAFDLLGQTLGLYPRAELARDIGVEEASLGHGAMTLAHNVASREEVAPLVERAREAGARVLREPSDVFWGGHVAYFADPDGHVWEIAWNPHAPLGPGGAFRWKGYADAP